MLDLLDGVLPEQTVADKINKSVRTLQRWEKEQTGPPVTRIGRGRFYNVESFRAWLTAQERKPPRRSRERLSTA
jgi:DNA-binding transcriptional MerR regulator